MSEGYGRATQARGAAAAQWQRTLWVMVGIQLIMMGAFSVLSPIMPLLLPEFGVETASAVDLRAGILNGVTSFAAAFASPVWGRVADRRGRKLMLVRSSLAIGVFTALMGVAANVWQFAFRALMGVFSGFSSAAIALVGGGLAHLTGSYRIPFYCTSATILLSLGLVWFAVDERFVAPLKARGLFIGGLLPTANALVGCLVLRAERGTIYGITASATFLGNSLGPLTGGAIAAAFGLRWVFLVTAAVLLANLLWV